MKQYFAETLQVISFKNDVYFLQERSKSKGTLISKSHTFCSTETLLILVFVCLKLLTAVIEEE